MSVSKDPTQNSYSKERYLNMAINSILAVVFDIVAPVTLNTETVHDN